MDLSDKEVSHDKLFMKRSSKIIVVGCLLLAITIWSLTYF